MCECFSQALREGFIQLPATPNSYKLPWRTDFSGIDVIGMDISGTEDKASQQTWYLPNAWVGVGEITEMFDRTKMITPLPNSLYKNIKNGNNLFIVQNKLQLS